MTRDHVIEAVRPMLAALNVKMPAAGLDAYAESLTDLHPADLDDAITAVKRSHSFNSAPPPSKIREAAEAARRKRITSQGNVEPFQTAPAGEGELRAHTIAGIGTIRLRVLPDDHPSLPRYYCLDCKDTGWLEVPPAHFSGLEYSQVTRCQCHPAKGGTNPAIVRRIEERITQR